MTSSIVLDASVVIKWFHEEPDTPHAERIRAALLDGVLRVQVPGLLLYEVSNVLVWKAGSRAELVMEVIDCMEQLPWWVTHPTAQLMHEAVAIAAEYKTSVYDAVYVVLALRSHVPLVTADAKLVQSLAHEQVVHLHDFSWEQ